MKKIISCILFLVLCGCQSNNANYGAELQPWIGQTQQRLIQSWGMPHNIFYITPQQKVWTYVAVSSEAFNGEFEPYSDEIYYPAINTPNYGLPSQQTIHYCKTSFTITGNIITDYSFNGDDCVTKR